MFIVTRLAMLLLRIMIPLIPLLSLQTMSALLPYALLTRSYPAASLHTAAHDLFVVSVAAADLGDCTVLSGSVCSIDLTNIASLSDAVTSAASSCVLAA